jgi:chromosome segregation ATPase
MTEGLETLERRILGLIAQYRDSKQQIREMESLVKDSSDRIEQLERENDALRAQVEGLRGELAGRTEREELVRNKLQQIIGQIDSLESEIAEIETVANES